MEGTKTLSQNLIDSAYQSLPRIIFALVIIVFSVLLAQFLKRLIFFGLKRLGIDRFSAQLNEIDLLQKAKISLQLSQITASFIQYFVIFLGIVVATDVLLIDSITLLVTNLLVYMPKLLLAGLILFGGLLIADRVKSFTLNALRGLGVASAGLISNFIFYFLFLAIAVSALNQTGIETEFLQTNLTVVIAGGVFAFALGYGLAAKDYMANFIASTQQKSNLKVGQTVSLCGKRGLIMHISNSSLVLQSDEGTEIIPLSNAYKEIVTIHED